MDAQQTNAQGSDNGIVFLIGAVYNILAGLEFSSLVDRAIEAIIGGLAFLFVKTVWNFLKPTVRRWKEAIVKFFTEPEDEK